MKQLSKTLLVTIRACVLLALVLLVAGLVGPYLHLEGDLVIITAVSSITILVVGFMISAIYTTAHMLRVKQQRGPRSPTGVTLMEIAEAVFFLPW